MNTLQAICIFSLELSPINHKIANLKASVSKTQLEIRELTEDNSGTILLIFNETICCDPSSEQSCHDYFNEGY